MMRTTRRAFLRGSASAASAVLLAAPALAQGRARVAIVGGGFAGATCAREVQRAMPRAAVTLIEASPIFTACPLSNSVIAGLRTIGEQRFGYDALRAEGIAIVHDPARAVDPQSRPRISERRLCARLRPAGAGAGNRHPLGCAARLRRAGGGADAACLEGGRADRCCCGVSSKPWRMAGRWRSPHPPIHFAARRVPMSGRA